MAFASRTWCLLVLGLGACPSDDGEQTSGPGSGGTTGEPTDVTATTIPLPPATDSSGDGGGSSSSDDTGGSSSGPGNDDTGSTTDEPGTTSTGEGSSSSEDTGPPSYDVGWCVLQFPPSVSVAVDEAFTLYIRVFAAGLTDQTGGNDPAPELVVELGYGLDGADPAAGIGAPWTYFPATPNAGYGPGAPNYSAANDEYWGEVTIDTAGIYDYAGRVSGDGGATWVYCDLDGLTMGGYTPDQAGHAEVGQ